MINVEIDEHSGFCFGVTTAIRKAEEELQRGAPLYCLGDIVHNGMECERLRLLGLIAINHDEFAQLRNVRVLLRAHGEPPETYEAARRNGIDIIDATCPVVLNIQKRIKQEYDTPSEQPKQIIIYGQKGHAEVLGLVGQTDGTAIVIESIKEIDRIDFTRHIYLYSQTTKSLDEFRLIVETIKQRIAPNVEFRYYDTICRQVSNRLANIRAFAASHDLVFFVCGKKSSNGKVLYQECLKANPNSYHIEGSHEIDFELINDGQSIGICGATSTPKWLMEECKQAILELKIENWKLKTQKLKNIKTQNNMARRINCIGILTSGGDAPGMNAAIRAVTRTAIFNGLKVKGIYRGYKGLITNEIKDFKTENVSNIVQQGGTILKTARCPEFKTEEGRAEAWKHMCEHEIDALVVIGGDGSLTGARILAQEYDIPCIGIPATIDNDLYGTDTTLGYDTALNTIVEAVDKIRDTANSHERIFFVEVMGRDAGFLALNSAIASGAEAAIIPEHLTKEDQLAAFIQNGVRKSKNSSIVLVAENKELGGAMHYAERVRNEFPQFDVRVSILGHLQRGGRPTAHDRIIASRMGAASIDALLDGQRNVMIGIRNDEIVYVPFNTAIKKDKPIDEQLVNVLHMLSI